MADWRIMWPRRGRDPEAASTRRAAAARGRQMVGLRRRLRPVAVILTAILVLAACGSQRTTERRPELQQMLANLVRGSGRIAPGASAVVVGPRGTWVGAAGFADVSAKQRMLPDARVRLESVSKLWVATLILQLVGEGRLRLTDTVERWLPGLLPYGNRITVRELLNHTSGIVDTNDITHAPLHYLNQVRDAALRTELLRVGRRLAADPAYPFPWQLWIRLAAALPLHSRPGSAFHYSNIGYLIAGMIAQRAGRADLVTLFRRRIIEPLGLTHTAYDPSPQITGPHAQGYSVAAHGKLTNTTTWVQGLGANGGIVSDASDEARFLQALMHGRLIRPAQLLALETPSSASLHTAAAAAYGLGTNIIQTGCAGRGYNHEGGGSGFDTGVIVSPDGGRVAVLLLNGRTADDHGDLIALDTLENLYCAG
jgi:D-alanyl-D-alanine carboxypeptidase